VRVTGGHIEALLAQECAPARRRRRALPQTATPVARGTERQPCRRDRLQQSRYRRRRALRPARSGAAVAGEDRRAPYEGGTKAVSAHPAATPSARDAAA